MLNKGLKGAHAPIYGRDSPRTALLAVVDLVFGLVAELAENLAVILADFGQMTLQKGKIDEGHRVAALTANCFTPFETIAISPSG